MLLSTNPHAKDSIYILYDKLKKGADFATIANNYSKDKGSATRGGDLGWFGRGMMIKSFEDVAFEAHKIGDITEPFETQYGWHIMKYMGMRNCLPLDSLRENLTKKILKDERYKEVEAAYLQKARAKYNIDPSMSDKKALQYIKEHLEDLNSDYRNLIREYHDGILLYDFSKQEVWDKASTDEAGLMAYYKAHKKDFKAKDFEGVRNDVVSAYQDFLEKELVKKLRQRYPLTIHYDVLYSIGK
jgi:peptidyl-prolyl cis-trans isomerase SurA